MVSASTYPALRERWTCGHDRETAGGSQSARGSRMSVKAVSEMRAAHARRRGQILSSCRYVRASGRLPITNAATCLMSDSCVLPRRDRFYSWSPSGADKASKCVSLCQPALALLSCFPAPAINHFPFPRVRERAKANHELSISRLVVGTKAEFPASLVVGSGAIALVVAQSVAWGGKPVRLSGLPYPSTLARIFPQFVFGSALAWRSASPSGLGPF